MRVELAHGIEVRPERRRDIIPVPQSPDPGRRLGGLAGLLAVKRIAAATGMRVDINPGFILAVVVVEQFEQHEVLEHIRVIARMEGVSVAKQEVTYKSLRAGGSAWMASVNRPSHPHRRSSRALATSLTVHAAIL